MRNKRCAFAYVFTAWLHLVLVNTNVNVNVSECAVQGVGFGSERRKPKSRGASGTGAALGDTPILSSVGLRGYHRYVCEHAGVVSSSAAQTEPT